MANILSLAAKINADASGFKLDPVQRALRTLGEETDKVAGIFDKFTDTSEAAAKAQTDTSKALQDLITARREGTVSAEEFAKAFERIRDAATQEAAALQRAAQITEANLTPLERYDRQLAELNQQLQAGRISQETYGRAAEGAAKGLSDAERAARGLAVQQKAIDNSATSTTLKFNELSGVFSALPGPLGNIAGRISGLASAGEGLSRIFAGGLTQGFSSLVGSVTALINPFTAALAGIAAFGAAAVSVARGLIDLEDRVENLGNIADKLGVSFEFIQSLEESARRSGTSIDAVSAAFGRLQKSVLGVDEESKAAQKALSEIGVTAQELQTLSPEEQYRRIGEALSSIEDPARRTATATALFGRAGADLIPFFNNLPGAASDIERLGRALTAVDRERIDSFGSALDELFVATQGLTQTVLLPFAGLAEGIASASADFIGTITAIADAVGRILAPAFDQIGFVVGAVGSAIGALSPIFRTLAAVIEPIGQFLLPAIVAQMIALNRVAIAGAITSLSRTFAAAATAAIAYATSLGTATAATAVFATAIRGLLASTGVGAAVVAFGLAANALISYFTAADDATDVIDKVKDSSKKAADEAARLTEELAKQDAQDELSAQKAIDSIRESLSGAIDESIAFGEAGFDAALQYQSSIEELQRQFDKGILNEESFRRAAVEAKAAYTAQIDSIKQAAEETEAITQRVESLLAKGKELPQVQQDLNAVEAEIARVEAKLVDALAFGTSQETAALSGRLAQLDQLQASLKEQSQGFTQGFDSAFSSIDSGIDSLINKATEFGSEGQLAAQQLRDGIRDAQFDVRDGILTKSAFDKEVERQKELFESRVSDLRRAGEVAQQIEERQQQIAARQFEIELERAQELATVRSGSIEINDLREGGISALFDTLKEDPAIAEARKQRQELEKIRQEIAKLNAEKVDILAGTG